MKAFYTQEYKDKIVEEIKKVGNLKLVCKKYGINTSTAHGWIHGKNNKTKGLK